MILYSPTTGIFPPVKAQTVAFAYTLLLVLAFAFFGTAVYAVNDDMAITALLKGLFGFSPGPDGLYISPVLGIPLSFAYRIAPAVPWYSLLLYVGIALASFVTNHVILSSIQGVFEKTAGLLFGTFFLVLIAMQTNFAAVSLLLWITGCAFLLYALRADLFHGWMVWLASSQMAVAYLLRPDILPVQMLIAAPLMLSLLLRGSRRSVLLVLSPLVGALLLSLLSGAIVRSGAAFSDYAEFNRVRSTFNDTSRSLPTTQTSQALSAVGWSPEDYLVAYNWWLHDGTIYSAAKIEKFLQLNSGKQSLLDIRAGQETFRKYSSYMLLLAGWLVVVLLPSTEASRRQRARDFFLYGLLVAAALVLMCIRFPERIAYPYFLMLFLNAAVAFAEPMDDAIGKKRQLMVRGTCLIFVACLLGFSFPEILSKHEQVRNFALQNKYIDQSMVNVLSDNGSDTIIADVNPHIIPIGFFPFRENDPILTVPTLSGGWLVDSPPYRAFLKREKLGDRSTVVPSMIDNRRVVLRFWDSARLPFDYFVRTIFLRHLSQHYRANGRGVDLEILKDFRQGGRGLVYFHLVSLPVASK